MSLMPGRVSGAIAIALHRGYFFCPDLMEFTFTPETDLALDLASMELSHGRARVK